MDFKLDLDYQEIALQYIPNKKLAEEIQNNIRFVEKYYGDVDSRYKEVEDQQIVYKQLGIIVFSCVEAIWKGIVMAVNENCTKRKCSCKQCKYKKFETREKILFDKLFGFELIGQDICERETDYYIKKTNKYGVPLDTRKNITKSDWILWVAALTDDKEKCEALYSPVVKYLAETPSRVPFGDLYGTETGEKREFYNRMVQGGIFAPLLKAKFHKYKI